MRVGVLALQGGFARHVEAFRELGAVVEQVRRARALERLDGVVIPGGESTTLLNLMGDEPWFDALRAFHRRGGSLLATCAGAIVVARTVLSPAQPSVGLLDATVERNAYGRQIDSFETDLPVVGLDRPLRGVFIRAPRFREIGPEVEVLARHDDEPVLVREGRVIAATFHPELSGDPRLHAFFLEAVRRDRAASSTVAVPAAP